jgi:osmoprotectant transport system substrate-binding protein
VIRLQGVRSPSADPSARMSPVRRRLPLVCLLLALALSLAGCGGSGAPRRDHSRPAPPGAGRPAVTIGTKSSPVSLLLGQLYAQALRARGFTVQLEQDVGTTRRALRTLAAGRIDVYPTSLDSVGQALGTPTSGARDEAQALATVRAAARARGLALLSPTPFRQAAGLAVLPDDARRQRLRTIADLARLTSLRLGATPAFRTAPGGLLALRRVYGLANLTYFPFTAGTQYQVLDAGKIDVAVVATTDGQLAQGRYALLADPRHAFGFQRIVPVVPAHVLRAEGPALAATIDAVSRRLTPRAMQQLDAAVTGDKQAPEEAARRFLAAHPLR